MCIREKYVYVGTLLMLVAFTQSLAGCSVVVDQVAHSVVTGAKADMLREDSLKFAPGVNDEQFVKSNLEANGKPIKELEFKDAAPAKKILIYDRTWKGQGYKMFFLAFDKEKNNYVFWRYEYYPEVRYKAIMNLKADILDKYFKAEWYVETLTKLIIDNNKIGNYNLAHNAAIHLLKEKSEFEDLNAKSYNNAAWFLATTKDQRFREPSLAIEYATQAVEYAKKKMNYALVASYLDTLAAGYAEKGDYSKATEIETEAYNIATDRKNNVTLDNLNNFKTMVDVYKSGNSYAMWKYGEKK